MNAFREFQEKTVDQAIAAACRFFDADREALEIDILSGGSSGIFGLGAKKAVIRAQRRRPVIQDQPPRTETSPEPTTSPLPAKGEDDTDDFDDEYSSEQTRAELSPEEHAQLNTAVRTVVEHLLKPIGDIRFTVDATAGSILVHIDDEENSGLIIGRDGQTITALQYLTNRIVSKSYPDCPRVQLDAGDYRQKQQEQLQGIALYLSQKAKKSGRVQSTRPLSSFHRRVVHMALQNDKGVQTRSKGDGPMKRVLILPVKRGKAPSRPPGQQEDSPRLQQS